MHRSARLLVVEIVLVCLVSAIVALLRRSFLTAPITTSVHFFDHH